ncbi:MAG TPA: 4a-hydroxytetrahydrobiopterin dehydratase [Bacteroidales bacterium]|nr:4a-hydroxytetrahydrobiopterin dehydratase [Bacteroidales bacterium]
MSNKQIGVLLKTKRKNMWKEENNQLIRQFEFDNFIDAFSFMTKVAMLAEKAQHHPTWENTYNKLTIKLSTHDAGDVVTKKDKDLAAQIDALL